MKDEELVEAMVKFMKQTNEILQRLGTEVNNIKVDISKLKKHQTRTIIVSRPGIVDAVGKEYKIDNGGNGEYKTS